MSRYLVGLFIFVLLTSSCGAKNVSNIQPEPESNIPTKVGESVINCYSGNRIIFSKAVFVDINVSEHGIFSFTDLDKKEYTIKADCVVTKF